MEEIARLSRVCSGWRPVKLIDASIFFTFWSVYKLMEHRFHSYTLKSYSLLLMRAHPSYSATLDNFSPKRLLQHRISDAANRVRVSFHFLQLKMRRHHYDRP
jgi:hypothetical protein